MARKLNTLGTPYSSSGGVAKVIFAIVLLVAAAGISWYFSQSNDDNGLKAIAYPCLPLDVTTTDTTEFIMVRGYRAPPDEHTLPNGNVVYAVFSHPDSKVVPLVDGKTLYFPVHLIGESGLETPPLPPLNKPLSAHDRNNLVRYLPDEVRQQLKAASEGNAR